MDYLGQFAIVHLILHVVLYLRSLLGFKFHKIRPIFKKGYPLQVQVCMIFISILLGTAVSNFIVDLLQYSTQVKYLIK